MRAAMLTVFLLIVSAPGFTVAQAPAAGAQAFVIEQSLTRVEFNNDGTGWRDLQAAIKVQDAAAVQQLAVLSFPYTQGEQTVSVAYVRVRQPDGTVVATPADNIRDLPADVTRLAPVYSDVMEKQVVVKGLDAGDTLEYEVRFNNIKPVVPGQFWFAYTFDSGDAVQDEELDISVPAGRPVAVDSPSLKPAVTDAAGRRNYQWQRANPAPVVDRDRDPMAPLPAATVELSTFPSWAAVGAWYDALQEPQLQLTPAIRAKAAALTRGLTGDDARIQAIYEFVAEHIHYVSLSFGIGHYQPHPAGDVLSNGYGDCKDKHTLLAALLRAAGYTAWPALVNVAQALDPAVPSPGQFNHVVTVVERGGAQEWLDATQGVAPTGWMLPTLRGQSALLVAGGAPAQLVTVPSAPPASQYADFDLQGALRGMAP